MKVLLFFYSVYVFHSLLLYAPLIPFCKPYYPEGTLLSIQKALYEPNEDYFLVKCKRFFRRHFGFRHAFLTPSCTDALEMSALLLDFRIGDEVLIPTFSYPSCANAFLLRGCRVKFVDSQKDHPNLDATQLEQNINENTKAILVLHYGGVACDMALILALAKKYHLKVIEDTAHSIGSYWVGKPLGKLGTMATFSFHHTKNITCEQGGLLVINDKQYVQKAHIVSQKGTDKLAFDEGKVDIYRWQELGSYFSSPSWQHAILIMQLTQWKVITDRRLRQWNYYFDGLRALAERGYFDTPRFGKSKQHNGHIFYLKCRTSEERIKLHSFLSNNGVGACFHYSCLHDSPYFSRHASKPMPYAKQWERQILRLPLFFTLTKKEQERIVDLIVRFFS